MGTNSKLNAMQSVKPVYVPDACALLRIAQNEWKINMLWRDGFIVLCWALLILCRPVPAAEGELLFKAGEIEKTLSRQDLLGFPQVNLSVLDPARGGRAEYTGLELNVLLTAQFGDGWRQGSEIVFTCTDGYRPAIPVALLQRYRAVLAYAQPGHAGFEPIARSNRQALDPGPYYLVWDTDSDAALAGEHGISWPWQIARIELVLGKEQAATATPPAGSGKLARQGFLAFREHCIKCHSINGEGADLAMDLNYPVNVTEYWRPEWLARFILDPQSLRYNSRMSGLPAELPRREQTAREILAYLRAMSKHKRQPRVKEHE